MPATTQIIRRSLGPGLYRLTVGLWYFNRPSKAEIDARRLTGEASFWITAPGDYEFRFEPYHAFELTWIDPRFEPEPEDPLLTAAVRLHNDQESLELARQVVEHFLALPAWGNPRGDGYGHNGDRGAANAIGDLAWTLNFLDEHRAAPVHLAVSHVQESPEPPRGNREPPRFAAFRQHPRWDEKQNPLVADGLHPSPAGNRLWARHLAAQLAPLVRGQTIVRAGRSRP